MKAEDWIYYAEGGANILFSYVGQDFPDLSDRLLRIKKRHKQKESHKIDPYHVLLYNNKLTDEFIGQQYRNEMKVVRVNQSFLKALERSSERYRSENRKRDFVVDVDMKFAFICRNTSNVWRSVSNPRPQFAFEIKPKWGFKPVSYNKCRYCIHQVLKERNPTFCPLDLFSGVYDRIHRAIISLLHSGHSNLKVFLNQSICCFDLLVKEIPWTEMLIDNVITEIFLKEPILRNLKQSQRMLSDMDITRLKVKADAIDWYHVLNDRWNNFDDVVKYLMSASLKDCSIFLSFSVFNLVSSTSQPHVTLVKHQQLDHPGEIIVSNFQNEFHLYYQIKVVDLDIKPIHKIDYYLELEQKIQLANQGPSKCVE